MSTPPKEPAMLNARKYFDDQPESIRRAFYSLGNYLAAQEVINSKQPVIMDRYRLRWFVGKVDFSFKLTVSTFLIDCYLS
jgi:hypothetical protein